MTPFQSKVLQEIAAGGDPYRLSRLRPGVSKSINVLALGGYIVSDGPFPAEPLRLTKKGKAAIR